MRKKADLKMRRNTGIAVTEAETHRARSSGRPREFDLDAALDAAVTVFWKKGYEGTSLPDLTAAMGINRPSLYAAFGNKEALFRKAVERYLNSVGASVMSALAEPKVRDAMRRYLTAGLCGADSKQPRGCMLINAALACGDKAEPIRQELAGRRSQMECAIRARLERAK
jgi:AcrR family transcriptional regulator